MYARHNVMIRSELGLRPVMMGTLLQMMDAQQLVHKNSGIHVF